jgi:Ser/Thr protein kinase RdoA (MazF antagonist)
VWFHGDVAPDNLLVRDGRLAAVLDFGLCGEGGYADFAQSPTRVSIRSQKGSTTQGS